MYISSNKHTTLRKRLYCTKEPTVEHQVSSSLSLPSARSCSAKLPWLCPHPRPFPALVFSGPCSFASSRALSRPKAFHRPFLPATFLHHAQIVHEILGVLCQPRVDRHQRQQLDPKDCPFPSRPTITTGRASEPQANCPIPTTDEEGNAALHVAPKDCLQPALRAITSGPRAVRMTACQQSRQRLAGSLRWHILGNMRGREPLIEHYARIRTRSKLLAGDLADSRCSRRRHRVGEECERF